jgi:hypothetical protein
MRVVASPQTASSDRAARRTPIGAPAESGGSMGRLRYGKTMIVSLRRLMRKTSSEKWRHALRQQRPSCNCPQGPAEDQGRATCMEILLFPKASSLTTSSTAMMLWPSHRILLGVIDCILLPSLRSYTRSANYDRSSKRRVTFRHLRQA